MSIRDLESPESSSPIVTRSVASALKGEYQDAYRLSAWQRATLRLIGRFPQGLARFVNPRFQPVKALEPAHVTALSINALVRARLADYDGLPGPFPCITVGMALGGASAHLALSLGGPFLPQAFVLTLRGGSMNGNINTYFQRSADLALDISRNNPFIRTVQHYDPVHDGWLTRFVNHLRLVLLDLPAGYAEFIHSKLQPGGTVCFLDCGARWLQYKIGERSVFQVGGWGDVPSEEYLTGSLRIKNYCQSAGLTNSDWHLSGYSVESGPESEWGTMPGLGEALEDFCKQAGYRFVRISLPEPHDFSRLAFLSVADQLVKDGTQPSGILIEMFSQFDATAVMKAGLLPLWLVYNTGDSLRFLESMRPLLQIGKPVFFSPLSTFSLTPDLVPWNKWIYSLQGLDWINIGARSSHYPADAAALVDWAAPLHAWIEQYPNPIQSILSAEELSLVVNRLNTELVQ
jgi:hypothetical protein